MAQWSRIHLPMQEMLIGVLGQEDPLEKEIATHSNSLAWDIPWTEEPGVLQSTGLQQSRTQLFMLSCETTFHTFMLLQMVIFKHFNF